MKTRRMLLAAWVKLDANGVVFDVDVSGAGRSPTSVSVNTTLVAGAWGSRTLLVKWRTPGGLPQDFSSARSLDGTTGSTQISESDLVGRPIVQVSMGGSAASAGALVWLEVEGEFDD